MPTARQRAISNAKALAQELFARYYSPGQYAYYVERNGEITCVEHIGPYERESVYYDHPDCAARIHDTGLGGDGYSGEETDYRNTLPPDTDATQRLPEGRWYLDYLAVAHLPGDLANKYQEGLWWDGEGWCGLEGEPCEWTDREIDNPSDPLVEAIEDLPDGWFEDEDKSLLEEAS